MEVVFGLPGEENLHMVDALADSSIRFITTRDERGAAFMADTYGALTGRPGVCLATLGPGAINLMLGVANAQLDRHPLVALTRRRASIASTRNRTSSSTSCRCSARSRSGATW